MRMILHDAGPELRGPGEQLATIRNPGSVRQDRRAMRPRQAVQSGLDLLDGRPGPAPVCEHRAPHDNPQRVALKLLEQP